MKMKEESEKAGLELNIQKIKIMNCVPTTSWQIHGVKVETVTDFNFLGSKITLDSGCSHEIQRYLLFGRKPMTNLGSLLKSRDITLPAKIHRVKAVVFPVVMYGCEHWTIKKAECLRTDDFDLIAVQGTLKSLLQPHIFKISILQCSAFFMVQLSHPYMATGKNIALTIWTFVSKNDVSAFSYAV